MKYEFVVGQTVQCVAPKWRPAGAFTLAWALDHLFRSKPKYGDLCIVEKMGHVGEFSWLRLRGFAGKVYTAKDFRPLAEPDISVFNAILADINAGKRCKSLGLTD